MPTPPQIWSVRELKAELDARGISHLHCTEKTDLVDLILSSSSRPADAASEEAHEPFDDDPLVISVLACPAGAHYATLSVCSDANGVELRRAYRNLALRLHPDKCQSPNASEAFKRVSTAFAVLSDQQERAYYDRCGGDSSVSASSDYSHGSSSSNHSAPTRRGDACDFGFGPPGLGRNAFGDRDAEELFRAFFGDEERSGGARTAGGVAFAREGDASISQLALRGLTLAQRLGRTFAANPWTLVTLLSGLASLVSVFETLSALLGGGIVLATIPAMGLAVYACPPEQRRYLAMLAVVLLSSPYFF
jgi:hypothetical protein